jgi:hypothetical protein
MGRRFACDECRTILTRQAPWHRWLSGSMFVMVGARQCLEGPLMLGYIAVVWLGLLVTGFRLACYGLHCPRPALRLRSVGARRPAKARSPAIVQRSLNGGLPSDHGEWKWRYRCGLQSTVLRHPRNRNYRWNDQLRRTLGTRCSVSALALITLRRAICERFPQGGSGRRGYGGSIDSGAARPDG